jgi:hypothetical protein
MLTAEGPCAAQTREPRPGGNGALATCCRVSGTRNTRCQTALAYVGLQALQQPGTLGVWGWGSGPVVDPWNRRAAELCLDDRNSPATCSLPVKSGNRAARSDPPPLPGHSAPPPRRSPVWCPVSLQPATARRLSHGALGMGCSPSLLFCSLFSPSTEQQRIRDPQAAEPGKAWGAQNELPPPCRKSHPKLSGCMSSRTNSMGAGRPLSAALCLFWTSSLSAWPARFCGGCIQL